jgi:hypothetical protein
MNGGRVSKNLLDLRFGIKRPDGFISDIWRAWVTRQGDVYLGTKGIAGIAKYSFHRSGVCRSAFTSQHGTPTTMTDRAMFKWRRAETPPLGADRASRAAWLAFPTDYLSRQFQAYDGRTVWIDAAPAGGATYVELSFTAESESRIHEAFDIRRERSLLRFVALPTGDSCFIAYYPGEWENSDLRVPGEGRTADLLFSADDPLNTGRPLRIRFGPPPKDSDAMVLQELGGFAVGQE